MENKYLNEDLVDGYSLFSLDDYLYDDDYYNDDLIDEFVEEYYDDIEDEYYDDIQDGPDLEYAGDYGIRNLW